MIKYYDGVWQVVLAWSTVYWFWTNPSTHNFAFFFSTTRTMMWGLLSSTCLLVSTAQHRTATKSLLGASSINTIPQTTTILVPFASYNLGKYGFCVIDNFLNPTTLRELGHDIETLRAAGRFRSARVGELSEKELNDQVRVAEQCFLHNNKQSDIPNAARDKTLERLDQLRKELSQISGTPLEPELDDLLYVYYPNGGFYKRHVDSTPGTPSVLRQFSILLYLNEQEWTNGMGGQLRLFAGDDDAVIDILPSGGRLVVFESNRIPHEVLLTNEKRIVLVGWFNRVPTDAECKKFS